MINFIHFLKSSHLIFAIISFNIYSQNIQNEQHQNVIRYLEQPKITTHKNLAEPVEPVDSTHFFEETKINPYRNYLSSIPSIMPLNNINKKNLISSFYQKRQHPIDNIYKMHYGIDIKAPIKTPVFATADGIVSNIYYNTGPIGYALKIKHSYNYHSLYGHLIELPNVEFGERVKRGQIIGYVGSTGASTAPHLHYCVYYKNKPINPYEYITILNTNKNTKNKHLRRK